MKKRHGSIASLGSALFFLGCHTVYGLHCPGFVCTLALTLPLCLWTWQSWLEVSASVTRYQSIVQEYFDRDMNSGDHLYVEHTPIARDYFAEGRFLPIHGSRAIR